MRIKVFAGDRDRPAGPVSTPLPIASVDCEAPCRLIDKTGRSSMPCQIDDRGRLVWWCGAIRAGRSRTFEVPDVTAESEDQPLLVVPTGSSTVTVHDRHGLFAKYRTGDGLARPILYPLNDTRGECVARHYPMRHVEGETNDHVHHRSCWVAWGDVNGVDHWSEEAGHGWQRHRALASLYSGAVCGGFIAVIDWTTPDGERQLVEHRTHRFYNAPGDLRLFDLTVRMMLTDGDVTFGDTKEGGICSIRVATSMDGDKGGHFVTGAGARGEADGWGKPAPWCDYVGPVAGTTVGIAVMDHPDNFRHPTPWHVRDYGLMTANPFGLKHFTGDEANDGTQTWKVGETIVWRYRVLIHPGDADQADVAGHYANYADPPEVTIDQR